MAGIPAVEESPAVQAAYAAARRPWTHGKKALPKRRRWFSAKRSHIERLRGRDIWHFRAPYPYRWMKDTDRDGRPDHYEPRAA